MFAECLVKNDLSSLYLRSRKSTVSFTAVGDSSTVQ